MKRQTATVWIALVLIGCTTLGLVTPKSFNEKALAADGLAVTIVDTVTDLVMAHKLSPDDADNLMKETDLAHEGVKVARRLAVDDIQGATLRVESISAGLHAFQDYLRSKK